MSSLRKNVEETLMSMGFDYSIVQRAVNVFIKNYGDDYNIEVILEIIVRLQNKDKQRFVTNINVNNESQEQPKLDPTLFELPDDIINDPFNPKYIPSYQCILNEIQICEEIISSSGTSQHIENKLQILKNKRNALNSNVSHGELSLNDYIDSTKKAMELDIKLTKYLYVNNRQNEAMKVFKRVQIMKKEILSEMTPLWLCREQSLMEHMKDIMDAMDAVEEMQAAMVEPLCGMNEIINDNDDENDAKMRQPLDAENEIHAVNEMINDDGKVNQDSNDDNDVEEYPHIALDCIGFAHATMLSLAADSSKLAARYLKDSILDADVLYEIQELQKMFNGQNEEDEKKNVDENEQKYARTKHSEITEKDKLLSVIRQRIKQIEHGCNKCNNYTLRCVDCIQYRNKLQGLLKEIEPIIPELLDEQQIEEYNVTLHQEYDKLYPEVTDNVLFERYKMYKYAAEDMTLKGYKHKAIHYLEQSKIIAELKNNNDQNTTIDDLPPILNDSLWKAISKYHHQDQSELKMDEPHLIEKKIKYYQHIGNKYPNKIMSQLARQVEATQNEVKTLQSEIDESHSELDDLVNKFKEKINKERNAKNAELMQTLLDEHEEVIKNDNSTIIEKCRLTAVAMAAIDATKLAFDMNELFEILELNNMDLLRMEFEEKENSECDDAFSEAFHSLGGVMKMIKKKVLELKESDKNDKNVVNTDYLLVENKKILMENKELKHDQNKLKKEKSTLMIEYEKLQNQNRSLMQEMMQLRKENNSIINKYNDLEIKYKNEKNKRLNIDNYLTWNYNDIVEWIINLENKRYLKYKNVLLKNMSKEEVDGECLAQFDITDLHRMEIHNFKDKKTLMIHIKKLTQQNNKHNGNGNDKQQPEGQQFTEHI